MVKKVPVKFEASDGREFDTEAEAKAHEAVITAERAYLDAARLYALRLADTQTTADGKPFSFDQWTYWYVRDCFGFPDTVRIMPSRWDCRLDDQDRLVMHPTDENRGSYRIGELYSTELAAKRALLVARRKRIAEYQEDTDKLEAELKAKDQPT